MSLFLSKTGIGRGTTGAPQNEPLRLKIGIGWGYWGVAENEPLLSEFGVGTGTTGYQKMSLFFSKMGIPPTHHHPPEPPIWSPRASEPSRSDPSPEPRGSYLRDALPVLEPDLRGLELVSPRATLQSLERPISETEG